MLSVTLAKSTHKKENKRKRKTNKEEVGISQQLVKGKCSSLSASKANSKCSLLLMNYDYGPLDSFTTEINWGLLTEREKDASVRTTNYIHSKNYTSIIWCLTRSRCIDKQVQVSKLAAKRSTTFFSAQ